MLLNTKEAICKYVNSKVTAPSHHSRDLWKVPFLGRFFPSFFAIPQVHVPIYTSPWKIKALQALERQLYAWHLHHDLEELEELKQRGWPCRWDLSKFIWPDQWKSYALQSPVALPAFTTEYEHCWAIYPQQEFYQEDLSYGVRPIAIFEQLVDIGGGYLWVVDKQNHKIYGLMVGFFSLDTAPQDFKLFLEQQPCSIPWEKHLLVE